MAQTVPMFLKAVPSDDCIQLPILRLGLPLEFNSFYWWSPNYLALSKTPLYAIHHKLFITAWTCKYCLMSWFSSIWPYHQIFQLCSVQIFIFESIVSILEDLKVFCEASNPRLLGQIYHGNPVVLHSALHGAAANLLPCSERGECLCKLVVFRKIPSEGLAKHKVTQSPMLGKLWWVIQIHGGKLHHLNCL